MSRRPASSIVASPLLVGAVTLLVVCVSVMLAVQANSGLPFVPTYNLKAELPGGANLIVGNEVRWGGYQIGLIEDIRPATRQRGSTRSIAIVEMKLDKQVEPLAVDTQVRVRPRSALGLKYIDIKPGRSRETYTAGSTIPIENSVKPIELDEFFGLYDAEFRNNQQRVLEGYGNGFAGRGVAINTVIDDLVPFLTHLEPVMAALNDPSTGLARFWRESRDFATQVAPVARTYARLFVHMADTFEALSRNPEALRQTIERGAPTLEQGIRSFPVQRPFLRDTAELMRRVQPVAAEMRRSLPPTTRALRTGAPVLLRAPTLYRETADVFDALREVAEDPNTLLALRNLDDLLDVGAPLVEHVAPYQTVCNYWNYYWNNLAEHASESVPGGTAQRVLLLSDNRTQDNRWSSTEADRPGDIPVGKPINATDAAGDPLVAAHSGAYSPALDAQGRADCRVGQTGYLAGPAVPNNRYKPSTDPEEGGGSHVVRTTTVPGGVRHGGTYRSRELGIDSIEDIP